MIQHFLKGAIFIVLLYACSPNNVKNDTAIAQLMDSAGMQGSFALLENGTEQFTIHNLSKYKDSADAPLNTFFIIPALIDRKIVWRSRCLQFSCLLQEHT